MGMSFTGVLQIVFITLKLIGKISWSWPVVLLPLEISVGAFIIYVVIKLVVFIKYSQGYVMNEPEDDWEDPDIEVWTEEES